MCFHFDTTLEFHRHGQHRLAPRQHRCRDRPRVPVHQRPGPALHHDRLADGRPVRRVRHCDGRHWRREVPLPRPVQAPPLSLPVWRTARVGLRQMGESHGRSRAVAPVWIITVVSQSSQSTRIITTLICYSSLLSSRSGCRSFAPEGSAQRWPAVLSNPAPAVLVHAV